MILSVILTLSPLLFLVYVIGYNKGRYDGTMTERKRWTDSFQGKK